MVPQLHVHVLQHVPFEGLGWIASWLDRQHARVTTTRLFAGDSPPESSNADLLIALGGPMSVHDGALYPWLLAEQALLRQAIQAGQPVLGLCLGAQLMAASLGAAVKPKIGRAHV